MGASAMTDEWVHEIMAATVAVGCDVPSDTGALIARLGPATDCGRLTYWEAMENQGRLYNDGSFETRAVVQAGYLPGNGDEWWALLEPNGFRASDGEALRALSGRGIATAFYWNVNSVMALLKVADDQVTKFNPLLEPEKAPEEGHDLPFGNRNPYAAALALIKRWTGVAIERDWVLAEKDTFLVERPIRSGRQMGGE